MDKIEKMRQEIERRINILTNVYAEQVERKDEEMMNYYHGKVIALEELRPFLDTLSEQPDKSLEEYASRAGFDYVDGIVQEEPGHRWNDHDVEFAYRDGIIAGAEWQKSQMMEEAVEGEVCGRVYDHINVRFADGVCKYLEPKNISHIPADVSKYNIGDKVKIVIVKEDKE